MRPIWVAAFAASMATHAAAASWVDGHRAPAQKPRPSRVDFVIAEPALPEPKPEPKPAPPPPPAPRRPVVVKHNRRRPPPAQTPAEPPSSAPPPLAVGVDESAISPGGDVAVPTGGTLLGEVGTGVLGGVEGAPPPPPEPQTAPRGARYVPIYEVTRLPRAKTAVVPYVPEAFRAAKREALVVVEVDIDTRGVVKAARVVRGAGFGLNDSALSAARRTRFWPAQVDGRAVPVRYQIPYRFRVRG